MGNCADHPDRAATWRCRDCGKDLCDDCVEPIRVQGCTVDICRSCRGHCVPLELHERAVPGPSADGAARAFLRDVPSTLTYPARGSGPVVLVVTVLFAIVLHAVGAAVGGFLPGYGFILTMAVDAFIAGYVALTLLNVVAASARGERGMPMTPAVDPDSPMASTMAPLLLLAGCGALCFAPAVAYYCFGGRHMDELFAVLLAAGAAYFPMGLLAVSVYERIEALDPAPIVRSILRVPGDYLLGCVMFYVLVGLARLAWHAIAFRPTLVADALRLGVVLYMMSAAAHLLGRLYYANRSRLRWAGVDAAP